MSENKHGCLKNTAIGCGVLLVLAIAIPFIGGYFVMRPFSDAIDVRSELEEQFGVLEAFVPARSGAVPPDRMETFLQVRRDLATSCVDFGRVEKQFLKMEEFDGQEEISRTEVLLEALRTTRSAMGMGPLMGEFFATRNRALLEAKMGIGEFTYIWVVSNHDRILNPHDESELFGPGPVSSRVRTGLLAMLANQRDTIRGQQEVPPEEIALVEVEIDAMESDGRRILWQDGLPPAIVESIEPYRQELDDLYCTSTAPLELMINVRHGPAIESK